jgi:hypothetical protein
MWQFKLILKTNLILSHDKNRFISWSLFNSLSRIRGLLWSLLNTKSRIHLKSLMIKISRIIKILKSSFSSNRITRIMLMNWNNGIFRIIMIWSNANSLFIFLHNCLYTIHISLSKCNLWSPLILKLLRIGVIYKSLVLILADSLESWLLFYLNFKACWKNLIFRLKTIKHFIIIIIVLIGDYFICGFSTTFSKFSSLWRFKNRGIIWIINWTLSRFSQKIILCYFFI